MKGAPIFAEAGGDKADAHPYVTWMTNEGFMADRDSARFQRQFDRIGRRFPATRGFLHWVRKPSSRLIRIPLAIILIAGGVFSFLPILGLWMLPLGLLLLALDVPFLQRPLVKAMLWAERKWTNWKRRRREKRKDVQP